MDSPPEPSDEQLVAELDAFLGSPRADTKRARRIERTMPITFAALRDGAPAYSPPPVRGARAITALAILTPAAAAAIVIATVMSQKSKTPQTPAVTISPPLHATPAPPEEAPKPEPSPPPSAGDETEAYVVSTHPPTALPEPLIAIEEPAPQRVEPPEAPETLWSLQPRTIPDPPAVADTAWINNDIDRFVLAKIESAGLSPAPAAPAAALLRRLHYDLTGLPPTAKEVKSFLASPSTYQKVVNELLDRPQFGEKWARHWLDLAAYDAGVDHAWRYREYVIAAFNKDKPFNRFVAEQIAGDLLPGKDPLRRAEAQVATGFLSMGNIDENQNSKQQRLDQVDAQIDLVTRTFLGLSVSCARCHDHKFDPVSQRDYHALAGVFESTDTRGGYEIGLGQRLPSTTAVPQLQLARRNSRYLINLDTSQLTSNIGITDRVQNKTEIKRLSKQVEAYVGRIRAARSRGDTSRIARLEEDRRSVATRLRKLQSTDVSKLNQSGARAIGLAEMQRGARDSQLLIDGEVNQGGDIVPRGFPKQLRFPGSEISIPAGASGRLELAKWLLADGNPLTARVYVNRVWAQLLGRGLARQLDEFGANSQEPLHRELLDHLANRFIAGKWSTKRLIHEIVLSRTYQLDSVANGSLELADPENTLFARRELRPLTAEELRDSMVASAGLLTGDSVIPADENRYLASGEFGALTSFADGDIFPLSSPFRTIYLPIKDKAPGMLALFNSPEPGSRTANRADTTSSTQALFMMNNEFVYQTAMEAAFRIRDAKSRRGTVQIVEEAFLALLSRPPAKDELTTALEFLESFSANDDITNPGIADTVDPAHGRIFRLLGIDLSTDEEEFSAATERRLNRLIPWTMLHHSLMQTAEYRILR